MDMSTAAAVSSLANRIAPWKIPALERLATIAECNVGETIYHFRDPTDYWYGILTGAARKCALTADGRRQIVDFLLPGNLFGFGARDTHQFSVEVLMACTTIARYPRRHVERLAESDPEVGRWVRETAFESISRLQRRMVILGRSSALAKVSAFLLEMADRAGAGPANSVVLPMSRYDIADYLAMAVETVSRALTELRERDVIMFGGVRCVQICDRRALEKTTDEGWHQSAAVGHC